MSEATGVWRALADPTRRELLDLLRDGPRTTGDLCARFDLTRFGVMRHLDTLAEAGLITVERRGRERWNHLNPAPLRQELDRWVSTWSGRLADTAVALARHAESEADMARPGTRLAFGEIDVRTELRVAAPREKVWESLLRIGEWWPHRFREGAGVTLEPHLGGRWFEDWGDGAGALYGLVAELEPGRMLRFSGTLGMRGAVVSVWSLELEDADDGGTLLVGWHRAQGDIGEETRATYVEGWPGVYGAFEEFLQA